MFAMIKELLHGRRIQILSKGQLGTYVCSSNFLLLVSKKTVPLHSRTRRTMRAQEPLVHGDDGLDIRQASVPPNRGPGD